MAGRTHSRAFKADVALSALNGEKTLAELAQPHDVHANQITAWKAQLTDGTAGLFGADSSAWQRRRRWTSHGCAPRLGSWRWRTIFCPARPAKPVCRAQDNDQSRACAASGQAG